MPILIMLQYILFLLYVVLFFLYKYKYRTIAAIYETKLVKIVQCVLRP